MFSCNCFRSSLIYFSLTKEQFICFIYYRKTDKIWYITILNFNFLFSRIYPSRPFSNLILSIWVFLTHWNEYSATVRNEKNRIPINRYNFGSTCRLSECWIFGYIQRERLMQEELNFSSYFFRHNRGMALTSSHSLFEFQRLYKCMRWRRCFSQQQKMIYYFTYYNDMF